MRAVVNGRGRGFLGSHLLRQGLLAEGWDVAGDRQFHQTGAQGQPEPSGRTIKKFKFQKGGREQAAEKWPGRQVGYRAALSPRRARSSRLLEASLSPTMMVGSVGHAETPLETGAGRRGRQIFFLASHEPNATVIQKFFHRSTKTTGDTVQSHRGRAAFYDRSETLFSEAMTMGLPPLPTRWTRISFESSIPMGRRMRLK